jgi:hypothetical protein
MISGCAGVNFSADIVAKAHVVLLYFWLTDLYCVLVGMTGDTY